MQNKSWTKDLPELFPIPSRAKLSAILGENKVTLNNIADEIVNGQVRLFGGPPTPLSLSVSRRLKHWTAYAREITGKELGDIKLIWEPARFGWVFQLGYAYHLTEDERYPEAFWTNAESFLTENPCYDGPNWSSAQEVALRILAFSFALSVFSASPSCTFDRKAELAAAIADHACRIPPSLAYARAQNNNHLIIEAAGLYTAGKVLASHPESSRWMQTGWYWFIKAICSQIDLDGAYMQHSANYHRLMLQAALWMRLISEPFPDSVNQRLANATRWLIALVDPNTGHVPNLGANDGAYILPLTVSPFDDYRSALQAASLEFLGKRAFSTGPWDDMACWLTRQKGIPFPFSTPVTASSTPHILHSPERSSWAYLRIAQFKDRPGHADQLHLDLWWRGLNLAQDAGTYRYNDPPPWDNALSRTTVHNTLTINDLDQMTYAGRFLWLDWAQAQVISVERESSGIVTHIIAEQDGYRRLGILHQRTVTAEKGGIWTIQDRVIPRNDAEEHRRLISNDEERLAVKYNARLHWLLPDWPWKISSTDEDQSGICLKSPLGSILLTIRAVHKSLQLTHTSSPLHIQLARSGELMVGSGNISPTRGWVSPTYNKKIPALSFSCQVTANLPIEFISTWQLPE